MRDWGPPTELDKLVEDGSIKQWWQVMRDMAPFAYGRRFFAFPYRLPTYKLRERAMYGGKKGRAAVRRLKARGCRPKVERFVLVLT
jgi:hypothetical protein